MPLTSAGPYRFELGWSSEPGYAFDFNNDAVGVHPELGFFAVVNGIGQRSPITGEGGGAMAVRLMGEGVRRASLTDHEGAPISARSRLLAACDLANQELFEANLALHADPRTRFTEVAAEIAAMLVADGDAWCAHVGDGWISRVRDGKLERLSKSFARATFNPPPPPREDLAVDWFAMGFVDLPEDYPGPLPFPLGCRDERSYDSFRTDAREGDVYLLCTELFWEEDRILRALRDAGDLERAAARIVEACRHDDGLKDATCLVVRLVGGQ